MGHLRDAWELYYEQKDKDKCTNCHRKIVENIRSKNGCIWCDVEYHKRQETLNALVKQAQELDMGY